MFFLVFLDLFYIWLEIGVYGVKI